MERLDHDRFRVVMPHHQLNERVKFKLGSISDECDTLVFDGNSSKLNESAKFGFPRPSLASLHYLPMDDEMSSSPRIYNINNISTNLRRNSETIHERLGSFMTTETHPIFVELFDLHYEESGESQWEETARWIKYEEDVEGVDHHWGRPHVAFLAFHSLIQIRHCFSKGVLLLNLRADKYETIRCRIADEMKRRFSIDEERTQAILKTLGRRNKHIPENYSFFKSKTYSVLPDQLAHKRSDTKSPLSQTKASVTPPEKAEPVLNSSQSAAQFLSSHLPSCQKAFSKPRSMLKRMSILSSSGGAMDDHDCSLAVLSRDGKIPLNAECAQVFVGAVNELQKVRFAMVRLEKATYLPELLDAPVPIRFIFVVLGPKTLIDVSYHEIGRVIATLMSNEGFKETALTATCTADFLAAIDSFVDQSIVIPPVEIDKKSLISVDDIKKALRRRKLCRKERLNLVENRFAEEAKPEKEEIDETGQNGAPPFLKKRRDPLRKTGRLFGGVIDDLKCRYRYYLSDLYDGFNFQCLASLLFMFFAAIAPAISFGGLMSEKTEGLIGPTETLIGQCLCGIIWGLFACQPLLIMAATGPVVVFEASLFKFCKDNEIDFLVFRFWCSLWLLLICIICVMLEGSRLVRHVTRFTEDIFATLIPLIFVYESVKFSVNSFYRYPLTPYYPLRMESIDLVNDSNSSADLSIDFEKSIPSYTPDTALLSSILLISTFLLAFKLRQLRNSHFFSRTIRRAIGDFGVPISIFIVVSIYLYWFRNSYVELLNIPDKFTTTKSDRGWIVWPFGCKLHWVVIFGAFIPALFVFILLFVEMEITQSLLSMEERGLRKGNGFHFDLLLVGVCGVLSSLLGLPWTCAAAVQSLAHCSSLTVMKRHAPGERATVDYVIEQRLTTIGVALLTGACGFLGLVLKNIPLAVLFGIFLYLGIMSMLSVQFLHRLLLTLIPQKYYPDYPYCQEVSMWRMHLFTTIQLCCLLLLWICKSTRYLSLAFPFLLMLVALFRRFGIPILFSHRELKALDQHGEDKEEFRDSDDDFYSEANLPL